MGLFSGNFYAPSLRMATRVNVIVPDPSNDVDPLQTDDLSVLYLLHGLAANADEWVRFSKIEYYAKKYNLVVVMPETQRFFYTDTAFGPRYFEYLTQDLPRLVSTWFRVPADREHTLIAGESMGGYGALRAAFAHPEKFGGVAALSAVADIREFRRMVADGRFPDMLPSEFDAMYGAGADVPDECDLALLVDGYAAREDAPGLRVCSFCGEQDPFIPMNRELSARMGAACVEHLYREWEGDHEWPFWDVAIQRGIQYLLGYDTETSPIY